ncbi:hypothetical protein [Sphingomonas sp. LR55]|uniref:hypothetical protein n=1 Tax=Sphingomonas sp. LR55 TaxID=3050231 RepID=UPI002FE26E77
MDTPLPPLPETIEAFLTLHDMAPVTFGRLAAKDPHFVRDIRGGRGFRVATKGRSAQGRDPKPVLMFVMVPSVRLPRVLDLDVVAQRWAANFEARFTAQLGAK